MTFQRRGIALNFEYFKRHLSGSVPYIFINILPEDWIQQPDGTYKYSTRNVLYDRGEFIYLLVNRSLDVFTYADVSADSQDFNVKVRYKPSYEVMLVAFAVQDAQTTELIVPASNFIQIADYYSTTVSLPTGGKPVFLATTEVANQSTPVYFDTHLSGTSLTLNSRNQPTFDTLITLYTIQN